MQKLVLAAIAATASFMPVAAQETVKTLYSGEPVAVTWENTLTIAPENFTADVEAGNYIYITFDATSDVIELKANGTWLPGTRFTSLGDNTPDMKTYITPDMLEQLKAYGLEICGASFTVKEVSVCNDGFVMPEGAIWGGYFWVENWNTLELFKTAFDNYEGQRWLDIYLSDDNGSNTGYFMQVMTKFDTPEAVWAGNDAVAHEATRATVDLKGIDVKAALADVDKLLIQSNPEGGSPYNITAVALRSETGATTDIDGIVADEAETVTVYNMQGIVVRRGVEASSATAGLPTGLYIVGNKKIAVK